MLFSIALVSVVSFVSATPLPIHSIHRRAACPEITQIAVPQTLATKIQRPDLFKDGYAHNIFYVGKGAFGCVYAVPDPANPQLLPVAAFKTSQDQGGRIEKDESDGLNAIGEFYGQLDVQVEGTGPKRHIVFMKYHNGVPLSKTEGWSEYVNTSPTATTRDAGKDQTQCRSFVAAAIEDIAERSQLYVEEKHWRHQDVSFANVLFPQTYTGGPSSQVVFIDWGLSQESTNSKRAYTAIHETLDGQVDGICGADPTAADMLAEDDEPGQNVGDNF